MSDQAHPKGSRAEWREVTLAVPCFGELDGNLAIFQVEAHALGEFAYHIPVGMSPATPAREITHVPTGHSLSFRVAGDEAARRIVEALADVQVEFFSSLTSSDHRQIGVPYRSAIPILERVIAVGEGMVFGINGPGDLSLDDLREKVEEWKSKEEYLLAEWTPKVDAAEVQP